MRDSTLEKTELDEALSEEWGWNVSIGIDVLSQSLFSFDLILRNDRFR